MQNEYYYLSELELAMSEFLDKEHSENSAFGWVPPNISRRMAEAAWAVLKNNKELNDYLVEQGELEA